MTDVAVVTDSTGCLPADVTEALAIKVVSLRFAFGDGAAVRELDQHDRGAFFDELAANAALPVTSPPTDEEFAAAYEPLLSAGRKVVSIHISSGLSDSCMVARRVAAELGAHDDRLRVIDSATAAGGLGMLAMVAAHSAARGGNLDAIVDEVRQARLGMRAWFALETLEYLRRGGRVGSAVAWIGSTLNVKPILSLEADIRAVERVRTRERALERLLELGRQLHASGADGWVVMHTDASEDARAFAERLRAIFRTPPIFVSEIGPVIACHTGPGLIGVCGLPGRFLK